MNINAKYPHVRVTLTGTDGNAIAIMGRVRRALKEAGAPREDLEKYIAESMEGDYDHLLQVAMRWVDVS